MTSDGSGRIMKSYWLYHRLVEEQSRQTQIHTKLMEALCQSTTGSKLNIIRQQKYYSVGSVHLAYLLCLISIYTVMEDTPYIHVRYCNSNQ